MSQQLSSVRRAEVALLSRHLLISDANCPLIGALLEGAKAAAMVLPPKDPPLDAMTAALRCRTAEEQQMTTLHLISHGRSGAFRFGDSWIDAEALRAHADELAQWGVETIALWSCHVGADADFVALLAELSGAAAQVLIGKRSNVLLQQIDVGDDRLVALQLAGIGITQQELEHGDCGYRINPGSLPMTSLLKRSDWVGKPTIVISGPQASATVLQTL